MTIGSRGLPARGLAAAMAVAGVVAICGSATASDYYIRTGFGFDKPSDSIFADVDCKPSTALYGCGTGPDGAPRRTVGGYDSGAALEFGVGFRATPMLRMEALFNYNPRLEYGGRANFLAADRRQEVSADISSLSAMMAMFVDLDNLGTPNAGRFMPFVGVGAGVARNKLTRKIQDFTRTYTDVPAGTHDSFAWMVSVGTSVRLSPQTILDVSVQRTDLGEVRSGTGTGQVVWKDRSREPLPLDLTPTKTDLTTVGIRFSLRYEY